jgi:hypothetical protein
MTLQNHIETSGARKHHKTSANQHVSTGTVFVHSRTENTHNIKIGKLEDAMKKVVSIVGAAVLSFALAQNAMAQASANQNLSLAVDAVYKIVASGNPGAMTIITGTAGTNALTSVTDASTNYSITQNFASTVKVTANLDAALPAGYTLQINLASAKGTSAGNVDISATTPASAASVVTAIAMGADASKTITYTFGALASVGMLTSTAKVVTLTLTN